LKEERMSFNRRVRWLCEWKKNWRGRALTLPNDFGNGVTKIDNGVTKIWVLVT
jgi:hypothetical protein